MLKRILAALALCFLTLPALAQGGLIIGPSGGGLGISNNLVGGVSPVTGTCASGYVLFNNAGILGCQAAGAASLTIGGSITGSTAGYGLYVSGATLGQFAYGTSVFAALAAPLNGSAGLIGYGGNSSTNTNSYDASVQVATDAFVQNALLLSMATQPLAITGGTYSFQPAGSPSYPVINCTASAGAVVSCVVFSGGSGFAVGDMFVPAGGNHDALLRVATVSGSAVASIGVVYGGTGYTTQSGIGSSATSAIPYTFLLSGTLTSNATIIMNSGTYQTASQQWFLANNTTGAFTVTVCVSNGSDACTAGRSAVIPQGANNSRLVGVQTDGVLNVDIGSIINVNDLQGLATGAAAALGSGVSCAAGTVSLLTFTVTSGIVTHC